LSPASDRARRIAIVASASGNGKTTLGRQVAERLGVPFFELDAWVHGPDWSETADDVLRARVQRVLAGGEWVIDGAYERKLGTLVLDAADEIVWLDLPMHVWLPRLLRRTLRRIIRREELWNGNRESLRGAFWGRDSLFGYALRTQAQRRREWPLALRRRPVTRLRSTRAVADWAQARTARRP
jgi:adenylate kinase family enzyme